MRRYRLGDQGGLETRRGGTFDFAIEGDGYFHGRQTPQGDRLTRERRLRRPMRKGTLVTNDGYARARCIGGAPLSHCRRENRSLSIAPQMARSASNGRATGPDRRLVAPEDRDGPHPSRHGVMFAHRYGAFEPVIENVARDAGAIIENSNTSTPSARACPPDRGAARLRAWGRAFSKREDERVRAAMKALMT